VLVLETGPNASTMIGKIKSKADGDGATEAIRWVVSTTSTETKEFLASQLKRLPPAAPAPKPLN
jgi:hypothetical protein